MMDKVAAYILVSQLILLCSIELRTGSVQECSPMEPANGSVELKRGTGLHARYGMTCHESDVLSPLCRVECVEHEIEVRLWSSMSASSTPFPEVSR